MNFLCLYLNGENPYYDESTRIISEKSSTQIYFNWAIITPILT